MENLRARTRGRRGRGRGRGTARRKKSIEDKEETFPEVGEDDKIEITADVEASPVPVVEPQPTVQPPQIDMEADISQLEAPTFTTLSRGPPEPMLRLNWNHPVNLLGEKVLNPMIHCCDTCLRPVLIYGRMIPCKHVFCLACAQRDNKACPRCHEKVVRVEQTALGTVFMCTHGGTRYGNTGCRRTYLSQRDLQAHINHRHVSGGAQIGVLNPLPVHCNKTVSKVEPRLSGGTVVSPFYEPNKAKMFEENENMNYVGARPPDAPSIVPASGPRPPAPRASNLITVPIQEPPTDSYYPSYSGPPPPIAPLQTHVPPPISQPPLTGHPPPHGPPPYFPPFDYPPPHTDTSVPPPTQWPGNPPFYG